MENTRGDNHANTESINIGLNFFYERDETKYVKRYFFTWLR